MKVFKTVLVIGLCAMISNINAGSSYSNVVDFYGHKLNITYDQQLSHLSFYKYDQREITNRLSFFRNANLKTSIYDLKNHINHYKLDDAASVILIDKFASRITSSRNNNQQTFIKYLLLKELNYDVILTKTDKKLNCLGNLSFKPGRYIFINYAGKSYKDLDFKNRQNQGKHLIYMDSKTTTKRIDRDRFNLPRIDANMAVKKVTFSFGVEKHEIHAESNASVMEFLGDLPMFDVGRQITALHMSRAMEKSVVSYITGQVTDRELIDQVRFILAFVQQVVPYGSDYDKYGEERFYYPEETIMAKTADCEDKAMLMAYLTKEILGLNSVGLFFETDEHLSIGIEIPEYAPTGSFKYKEKTYVSCEPTSKYPRLTQSQFDLRRVDDVIPF